MQTGGEVCFHGRMKLFPSRFRLAWFPVPLVAAACLWTVSCVSSGPEHLSQAEITACENKAARAMAFETNAADTRHFFANMSASTGPALQRQLNRYYEVLGVNLSSVLLMLDSRLAERVSLNMRIGDRDQGTWLMRRLSAGRSVVDMGDVASMEPEGQFLRVELKEGVVSGYFYVLCEDIEGRTIGEQTFVDYFKRGQEPRKMSVAALVGLMDD